MTSVKLLLCHERYSCESSQAIVTPPTLPQLEKTKYNHQNHYIIYLVLLSLQLFVSIFLGMCAWGVCLVYIFINPQILLPTKSNSQWR